MRAQLARPESRLLSPEAYDQLFSMHGTTMIFWYASPILSGFSNYLVPLMLGARDMAFPRLNAFSYWTFLLSGLFIYSSALGGGHAARRLVRVRAVHERAVLAAAQHGLLRAALLFLTDLDDRRARSTSSSRSSRRAARACRVSRMPLFMWSTLTTSVSMVFALPALTAALIFLELDRRFGTHFYDPVRGGAPAALAAPVLGLRPSVGLHHLPAGDGHGVDDHPDVLPPADRRTRRTSRSRR